MSFRILNKKPLHIVHILGTNNRKSMRCEWSNASELMQEYHDKEWGTPVRDDKLLFEHFVLDCFQAGLSWRTILHKRENFRAALDNFDYRKIANYDQNKIDSLLNDVGIIRNKLKVYATISNAQKFMEVQRDFGGFSNFIWSFTYGKTIQNNFRTMKDVPATSAISDKISKELKARGFKFVGSTICYSILQAVGIVNDHIVTCPRHSEVQNA